MPLIKLNKSSQPTGFSLNDPDFVNFLAGGESQRYVSAEKALKNSDIFSLIMQLSGDLAMVRYSADTDRSQAIIDNPSTTTNGFSFWQGMFAQLLLDGNAYAYRHKNVNGVDLSWEYLRPSQVQPMLLEDGSGLIYNINFDEPEIGYTTNIPSTDVIHIRLLSKNGGKTGISPLSALLNELKIRDASDNLTLKALKSSIASNGILKITHGGLLDEETKAARSRQVKRQTEMSDGGPLVLDDLEDYQPLEMKANIASLLSQADWTKNQVAKVYGVPDSYLNGQGDQQSSITQIGGQYAKSLNRYVQPIVSELNDKLNTHISADIRVAIDAMGDQYASTISSLTKDGTISSNQARFILQKYGYLPE
ncbi:phage portal protein, HK97 family [Lactobacillus hominis DSM 23910 = CRBIP 24.179]|uniref:Putative portal protein n=1 Tax=Lactobacillus hominis DSM 23910 = CRBIP 24.179 TaxID=1423758 RepID=I7IVZ7_9LACO|nr:phage portal protein [Lactobacillus hominis]KRM84391.1 phage portal protein, HK97 family [Lactobacillus hominis DSM 23910 = CRBIP 24.179]CCI82313.1 Putative portal protein [Lactobacillus hominis DSM 23910 = CRBIP 24.179]